MGEEIIANDENIAETKPSSKLTLLPLVFLIFYEVSGGPFGVEDSVKSGGGPLLAVLGFLIFPLIWSIPEAIVTAELCLPPSLLLILVMVLATAKTFLISGVIIVLGFCLHPFLALVKEKRWARFIPEETRPVLEVPSESQVDEEHGDDGSCIVCSTVSTASSKGAMIEVFEGDARDVLCEVIDKHHASLLVVGSHGYRAIKSCS
ncbi:putative polyamine transporter [Raphanus sativus]|nr:putative polyamine transporter [Raphanus sativus]